MFLQCYTWIIHLFQQIIFDDYDDVEYFDYLPDEVIVNILSRLPKETIIQCRKVCKKWWMLTSSSQFIELHQTMVKPLTLQHMQDKGYLKLFVIDEKKHRKKECNLGFLKKVQFVYYISSCNGLVLLSWLDDIRQYHVLNPLSAQGKIIATVDASDCNLGYVCGFFFHPLAKEYRILTLQAAETGYVYDIYLFGAKMWRKTATPYFNCRPLNYRMATIVNRCLHWYIGGDGIMVFDMITEEFSVRLTPLKENDYKARNLLLKEDRLCFSNVGPQRRVMDIWIMEDYKKWSWIKKYVVDLEWDVVKYPMEEDYIGYELSYVDVISIHKNEMMLYWKRRGLFSYHLGSNTIRKIRVKLGINSYDIDGYGRTWNFMALK